MGEPLQVGMTARDLPGAQPLEGLFAATNDLRTRSGYQLIDPLLMHHLRCLPLVDATWILQLATSLEELDSAAIAGMIQDKLHREQRSIAGRILACPKCGVAADPVHVVSDCGILFKCLCGVTVCCSRHGSRANRSMMDVSVLVATWLQATAIPQRMAFDPPPTDSRLEVIEEISSLLFASTGTRLDAGSVDLIMRSPVGVPEHGLQYLRSLVFDGRTNPAFLQDMVMTSCTAAPCAFWNQHTAPEYVWCPSCSLPVPLILTTLHPGRTVGEGYHTCLQVGDRDALLHDRPQTDCSIHYHGYVAEHLMHHSASFVFTEPIPRIDRASQ